LYYAVGTNGVGLTQSPLGSEEPISAPNQRGIIREPEPGF